MNKRIRQFIVLLCLAVLLLPCVAMASEVEEETAAYVIDRDSPVYAACEAAAESIAARHILVYDATDDEILYTRTVDGGKLYPASTTKLFSTYVALQYLDAGTVITAGSELDLLDEGSSVAYIAKNNQLTAEMLVEGMLLPSGNDAALVLAAGAGRAIAGDAGLSGAEAVRVFVEEMNRMGKELGLNDSQFCNPHGFHVGAHYSSIEDMARMAKLALENPIISRYMARFEDDVIYASGHSIHWINTNSLLDPESEFHYPGAIGMKTGRTSQAGYCLMAAFKLNGHKIVIGVFGYDNGNARYRDVVSLLNACK